MPPQDSCLCLAEIGQPQDLLPNVSLILCCGPSPAAGPALVLAEGWLEKEVWTESRKHTGHSSRYLPGPGMERAEEAPDGVQTEKFTGRCSLYGLYVVLLNSLLSALLKHTLWK